MDAHKKLEQLKKNLLNMKSIVVAFSGGVDSTFLLKVAHDVLGDKAIAVTARSQTYPERECLEAIEYTKSNDIIHEIIVSEELEIDGFSENPLNRCYLCKNELFDKINDFAKKKGAAFVAEGSNLDDLSDYRPGMQAVNEHKVESPLKQVGFTKDEIRETSYHLYTLRLKEFKEDQRDELIQELAYMGIATNVHFTPLPMFTYYKNLGYSIKDYPNAYNQYANEITLPVYSTLKLEDAEYVVNNVIECAEKIISK